MERWFEALVFLLALSLVGPAIPGCDDGGNVNISNCTNLRRDGDETDVDCGGSCDPCGLGDGCQIDADCVSENCSAHACRPIGVDCEDGVQAGTETDVDCGGECPTCADGKACVESSDCTSGVCNDGVCQGPSCDDGLMNGDESDVDCGGGDCPGCAPGMACDEDSDCASSMCSDGYCQEPLCSDHDQNGNETDVDCGGIDCDPCEADQRCLVAEDCVSRNCLVSDTAEEGVCVAATCEDLIQNGNESDVDCGGDVCTACRVEQSCNGATDCETLVCGDDGTCQAPTCEDGVANGQETDVDCGGIGSGCEPCENGRSCDVWEDCLSGYCEDETETCQPPSCSDGVQNGDEGDVDCGGTAEGCDRCPNGSACLVDGDCASSVCVDDECAAATCEDRTRNASETDVDCGGPDCPACGDGDACAEPADCASGVCADSVCQVPTCDDGVQNGGETDIDCGGLDCDPCEDGAACADDEDCTSLVCYRDECQVPACDDGVQNGDESDVDCGGETTCDRCEPGDVCVLDSDCIASAYCEGGLCQRARSCLDLLTHRDRALTGAYMIDPDGPEPGSDDPCQVYCDMVTEGGGWTLVASSRGTSSTGTFDDKASVCYADLATDRPGAAHAGVWEGMRARISSDSDIRFSCRSDHEDATFEVDMVFYENDWYRTITTGTDSHSCFNVLGDANPAPARRDLISGDFIDAGVGWGSDPPLAGETVCSDLDSFTVDFDGPGLSERGVVNATSWGEALVYDTDHDPPTPMVEQRCGPLLPIDAGAWFIWVREPS